MRKINLVDLNSTFRSSPPSHLRIVDVIKLLFRSFEQNHRGVEPSGNKALGPIGLSPIRSRRPRTKQTVGLAVRHPLIGCKAFGEAQPFHPSQTLAVIVHLPQPAYLTMLHDPGVENGK